MDFGQECAENRTPNRSTTMGVYLFCFVPLKLVPNFQVFKLAPNFFTSQIKKTDFIFTESTLRNVSEL